ncbi:GNAT family N-acetyltransferase [Cytobacillus purgationiresistens]|uniref:GNAT superfamily N-acetyltransferase n=1 Tax=Cytobacillus purgationiresistens TaxID=863449 RepID=A0ABU0AJB8_9BACI|nr:GNAT family N-acetyltransferase [Cytobacillus purgationiresistens]MDQ0271358.1 GNAT superfamily N-acetyltransferase [Cytobacillus purgationiresistens]
MEWKHREYTISTNKQYLDREVIYEFLHGQAYWSNNIPKDIVMKSIENTDLVFGVYQGDLPGSHEQIGFARVITDSATFAYLCDVFILPAYRGLGLSKWLVETIVWHPDLHGIRKFMLATKDAHTLYERYGFEAVDNPELILQKVRKIPY